jgi:tetratricopeptide (TPR) repeat protein
MSEAAMSEPRPAVDLDALKREVDALQIAVMAQRAPWYRSIPTLLSIVALLFSFGTTAVSYVRTQAQDIQNARTELRVLLQRLAALPRENVEIMKKYEDDPASIASMSGFINQENTLLARQAAELAVRIPAEYVSATEYYAIALALQFAYNIDGAKTLFSKAIDASTDLNDRVAALRSRANLLFLSGQPDAGRIDYQRALNVFADFGSFQDPFAKSSIHIYTELSWAFSEANIGLMGEASRHIEKAEGYLATLPPSPGVEQLRSQIDQARGVLSGSGPPDAAKPPALGGPPPFSLAR